MKFWQVKQTFYWDFAVGKVELYWLWWEFVWLGSIVMLLVVSPRLIFILNLFVVNRRFVRYKMYCVSYVSIDFFLWNDILVESEWFYEEQLEIYLAANSFYLCVGLAFKLFFAIILGFQSSTPIKPFPQYCRLPLPGKIFFSCSFDEEEKI